MRNVLLLMLSALVGALLFTLGGYAIAGVPKSFQFVYGFGNPPQCQATSLEAYFNLKSCVGAMYYGDCEQGGRNLEINSVTPGPNGVYVSTRKNVSAAQGPGTGCGWVNNAPIFVQTGQAQACPPSSTDNGTDCTCNSGTIQSGNQCVAPDCQSGRLAASGSWEFGTDPNRPILTACKDGCVVSFDGVAPDTFRLKDGVRHYLQKGSYYDTGEACQAGSGSGGNGPAELGDPDSGGADTCPAGKVPGTVNGRRICVTPGDPSDQPGDTTTTTKNPPVNNPDGSTTTTTTTTGPNGEKTTSTTTTYPDGRSTTTVTVSGPPPKPEREPGPCEKNPNAAECVGNPVPVGQLPRGEKSDLRGAIEAGIAQVQATGLGGLADGMFTVSAGGSCPTWEATVPYLDVSVEFDHLCTPGAATMLDIVRGVVLVVAGFAALRVMVH